ncbi:hypothetical protein JCM19235_3054 [Vibrio maritimus]|uniref:Uncharacterized protein n=1 Tax=Vibrio maritimus TaxID=990268 RepID=A0A090S762_9VIBR|nr:hypothetical protein JCM19235_3054 [Vibrio maritimus]
MVTADGDPNGVVMFGDKNKSSCHEDLIGNRIDESPKTGRLTKLSR